MLKENIIICEHGTEFYVNNFIDDSNRYVDVYEDCCGVHLDLRLSHYNDKNKVFIFLLRGQKSYMNYIISYCEDEKYTIRHKQLNLLKDFCLEDFNTAQKQF